MAVRAAGKSAIGVSSNIREGREGGEGEQAGTDLILKDGLPQRSPASSWWNDFYEEVVGRLRGLGLETRIWTMPVEIPDAIPFEQDRTHASYDPEYVHRFWRILLQVDRVLTRFRGQFLGKDPSNTLWVGRRVRLHRRCRSHPLPTVTAVCNPSSLALTL